MTRGDFGDFGMGGNGLLGLNVAKRGASLVFFSSTRNCSEADCFATAIGMDDDFCLIFVI